MNIDRAMQLDRYRDYLRRTEHALAEVQGAVQGALMFDGPARAQLFTAQDCLRCACMKMRHEVYQVETAAMQRMTNNMLSVSGERKETNDQH